jgi:hypothetical protein
MSAPNTKRGFDWEAAGREFGERLGEYHAVVVIGIDPVATGSVAVGIARAQATHRRVAVGDLFAESPPIQELVHTDDPHGLVDSFLYGVSLNKIAYEVPGAGQLFVMPSGTEPPPYEEILPNPRWHRLSAGFREVSALLVLAVPASAPQVDKLVAATDGAVIVGDAAPALLPVARIIGSVRETRSKPVVEAAPQVETPTPLEAAGWSRRRVAAVSGIALTLGLAVVAAWLAYRPFAEGPRPTWLVPDCGKATPGEKCRPPAKGNVLAIAPDSTKRDSTPPTTAIVDAPAVALPTIHNPSDSLVAAAYAVELMAANTQAGAILKLQRDGKELPAATFAPAVIQGARWFKVTTGAYSSRAEADSLLNGLRRRNLLLGGESVVKLPFAFLIDSGLPATAVPGMVANYADRQQPIYALRQANGTAWLLVGAFESVEQASLYVESLRASGIQPVLVYRKGRAF